MIAAASAPERAAAIVADFEAARHDWIAARRLLAEAKANLRDCEDHFVARGTALLDAANQLEALCQSLGVGIQEIGGLK